MRMLLTLTVCGLAGWWVYRRQQDAQLSQLPTVEHKKLWWQQVLETEREEQRRREALSA